MDLSLYMSVLWHRRWTIIVVFAIIIGAAGITSRLLPRIYESASILRLLPYSAQPIDYQEVQYFDRFANTFIATANSDFVRETLAAELGITSKPDYSVDLIPGSELVKVTAHSQEPAESQRIASILTDIISDPSKLTRDAGGGVNADALKDEIDQVQSDLDALEADQRNLLAQVPLDTERLNSVSEQIDSNQRALTTLQNNYTLALVVRAVRNDAISLVQPVTLNPDPIAPSTALILLLGCIIGAGAGILVGFLAEARNPKIHIHSQIEALAGAPVLGSIPRIPRKLRSAVVTDQVATESFRQLAYAIHESSRQRNCHLIVVCSPQPRDGKSTVVSNLASVFAEQGYKTLIIDADLRLPTLHRFFKLKSAPGLAELSATDSSEQPVLGEEVNKLIRRTKNGVDILTAGSTNKQSVAHSLDYRFTSKLLDYLKEDYQVILIDTPALTAVADALAFVEPTHEVLLVVRRKVTHQFALQSAISQLYRRKADLIGIAVNDDDLSRSSAWHAYYRKHKVDVRTKTNQVSDQKGEARVKSERHAVQLPAPPRG